MTVEELINRLAAMPQQYEIKLLREEDEECGEMGGDIQSVDRDPACKLVWIISKNFF